MTIAAQIAKHLREVLYGGNWTFVNLSKTLEDVTWEHAITKVQSFNTIAALTYHIGYYVTAILGVMKNEPLTSSDKFSFDHPPIHSDDDWRNMLHKNKAEADELITLIEQFPDAQLDAVFADEKYGTYYRNFHGLIEHTHYHMGQIVIIKKMLTEN
ncbi:MAG: DinB family protein [Bacteroidetes bacterium]|nr:DinB family protein [Bacteroidota bacterium]